MEFNAYTIVILSICIFSYLHKFDVNTTTLKVNKSFLLNKPLKSLHL